MKYGIVLSIMNNSNLCYKIPAISIKMIARLMGDTEKVVIDVYNHVMEEKEDVIR